MEPKGLANRTAQTIALDRVTGVFDRDGQPQARRADVIRFRSHREESIAKAPSASISGLEVGLASQATLRGKSELPSHRSPFKQIGNNAPKKSKCGKRRRSSTSGLLHLQVSAAQKTRLLGPTAEALFEKVPQATFSKEIRVSASGGPSSGAVPAPCARSWLPCAHGTHVCACGVPCWVDKCASWLTAPVQMWLGRRGSTAPPRQRHARAKKRSLRTYGLAGSLNSAKSVASLRGLDNFLPIEKGRQG